MVDKFGVRGCHVRLNISLKTEVLNWLEKSDPKNAKNPKNQENGNQASHDDSEVSKPRQRNRRNSLVGASLFSVNNNVEEHSFDFLQKIQRPCALQMEPTEPMEQVQQVAKKSNVPDLLAITKNPVASNVGVQDTQDQVKSSQSGQIIRCNSSNVSGAPAVSVNESNKTMVLNNFDPFRRLPNPPFMVRGRVRAQSVDCVPSRRPSLSTIFEHEFECESFASLVYDCASDSSPPITIPVEGVKNGSHADHAETQMSSNGDMAIVSKWITRSENFEL